VIRRAFTLVELLVVISIIGLLSTIAIVSLNGSRDKARIASGKSFEQSINQKLGDRLEGEWFLDSVTGGVATDTSGNGRTGTAVNATLVPGVFGNAYSFSATGYVDVGPISINPDITVSAWIYPTISNQLGFIVGKLPVNSQWELFLENGYIRWRGGATVLNTASCPEPTPNAWHHVVGTQSGGQAAIYVDGKQCVTGANLPIANGNGNVQIGTFSGSYNFTGIIDQVRIYSGSVLEP
jgi:prepilin-type N-terminal cleavage/methylation domain-containing protein